MNQNRMKRGKTQNQIARKVIRCSLFQRPVWEHEVCTQFLAETPEKNNCKNCKYSF